MGQFAFGWSTDEATLPKMPDAKNSDIKIKTIIVILFIFYSYLCLALIGLKDIVCSLSNEKEMRNALFFAKTLRHIHACWIRFINVSRVSIRSISAATAHFPVFADSAFALQNASILEAFVIF